MLKSFPQNYKCAKKSVVSATKLDALTLARYWALTKSNKPNADKDDIISMPKIFIQLLFPFKCVHTNKITRLSAKPLL
jgi:hypothetical protein